MTAMLGVGSGHGHRGPAMLHGSPPIILNIARKVVEEAADAVHGPRSITRMRQAKVSPMAAGATAAGDHRWSRRGAGTAGAGAVLGSRP